MRHFRHPTSKKRASLLEHSSWSTLCSHLNLRSFISFLITDLRIVDLGCFLQKLSSGAGNVAWMAERLPSMHESCVQSPVLHKPGMVEGKSCPCRLDEMAQWVQCLLYLHADLSPYPQHPHKSSAWQHTPGFPAQGSRGSLIARPLWPANLAASMSFGFS